MFFPNIIYYFVLIFTQFNILSVIAFIISIQLQTTINAIFLGFSALKSKENVMRGYLIKYPDCIFDYHNVNEAIEKKVLNAVTELPASVAFGKTIVNSEKLQLHIYSVHPINSDADRPKNLVAYSTPTGALNIGNFVFMRDKPLNSPKFGLYHEIGHITFDNSLEYHETYSFYFLFIISLIWFFVIANHTIIASLILIAFCVLTILIIFESIKVKKSAKIRSEIRADAFAVRFISDEERSALLRNLYKYKDYYYDKDLT